MSYLLSLGARPKFTYVCGADMLSTLQKAASSPPKKLKVLLLSSEWWSRKGGISTLNRILARQLAKHPLVEVTVFLLECSEDEKKDAILNNIKVVKATKQLGLEEHVWLLFPPDDLQIDLVIGHGAVLGAHAKVIRDRHQCKWVQVAHTAPKELGMWKSYQGSVARSDDKHKIEVELCEKADFVVGVGPKLGELFQHYIGWCKIPVVTLTPGIFDEYSDIEHVPRESKRCRVLAFGRGDKEDFKLKGFDIAAKAVARLSDTILIYAGACKEDLQQVTDRFLECGISPKNLDVRGFLETKHDLIRLFCEVDLAIMPSRTDGFGLTALEALSAGLPVLVSRNTGFGEALSKIPFGSIYVIDSQDPSVWADKIKQAWMKDEKTRHEESNHLLTFYKKKYNWERQCNDLVAKWRSAVFGEENNKLSTELDKESKEVESDVQQMKIEMDDTQVKLKVTSIELGKTQARNKTLEKHEQSEAKNKTMSKMEDTITELQGAVKLFKQASDKKLGKSSVVQGKIESQSANRTSVKLIPSPSQELSLESSTPSQELTLAVEDVTHAKTCQESSTQTYDTAFIPCEACVRTQKNLIEVGNMVIKVCESQGLPSSLAKQKKLLRQSLMVAADLSRWASEQSQDLARITDHLDNLYAQINLLEDKLSRSKQVCAQLEKEIQDLEKQLLDKDSEGEKNEVDLKEKLKQVVAEKDLLLTDAEQLNNDLMKGKDVLQGMELKLAQMLEKISPRRAYKNLLPCGNNTVTNLD